MTRVAAIDCGTNSIRLLILDRSGDQITEITRQVRMAKLGQGVDATGEFHPEALQRTFAICGEYAELLRTHDVERARFVATSAARDVKNRDEFFNGVRERLGLDVEVISGDEEARLSAEGVMFGVEAPQPALIFDIGGGSTELILMNDGDIRHSVSLNIGAVRIRERFLLDDPPTAAQQTEARAYIAQLLDTSGIDFAEVVTAIGVAGTVTTTAAAELGLQEYSRDAVHETVLTREAISRHTQRWLKQTVAETEQEPCLPPLRAQVICAGAMILDEIVSRVPAQEVIVSETDILDGLALKV